MLFTSTNIHAEDAQSYAAVPTLSKKYFYNAISLGTAGNAGTIELDLTMNLVTTSAGTEMTFYNVVCTPSSSTTSCLIESKDVYSYADYTSNYDNNTLIVDFYIKTVKNSKTYYTVYQYVFKNNNVYSHGVIKSPSTTKYTIVNR